MNPTPTERLFAVVAGHGPGATDLVAAALACAGRAHHGDFRKSGDPHVTHPVAVAATVADLGAGPTTIVAALLHDVPGRTTYSIRQLRAEFGDPVGDLLDALVELDSGTFDDLAPVDPRAVALKVACRLHNMQTIGWLEKSAQQRKAHQTRRLVVSMARSLGFAAVAAELDTLATDTLGRPTLPQDAGDFTDLESGAGLRAARARAWRRIADERRWNQDTRA